MNSTPFTQRELQILKEALSEVMSSARTEFRQTHDLLELLALQNKVMEHQLDALPLSDLEDMYG